MLSAKLELAKFDRCFSESIRMVEVQLQDTNYHNRVNVLNLYIYPKCQ